MRVHTGARFFWSANLCCSILVLAVIGASHTLTMCAPTQQNENKFEKVRLSVVSQRRRPEPKANQLDPKGRDYYEVPRLRDDLLIRFRLANDSNILVFYLAILNTIEPAAYQLFRDTGDKEWKATSPGRGREGHYTGGGYQWLMLPPNTAIEFEAFDRSTRGQEHALSIFINSQPSHKDRTEFFSELYTPIKP